MSTKKEKVFHRVQSSSLRTNTLRDTELNRFHQLNPAKPIGDKMSLDNDSHIKTKVGTLLNCCTNPTCSLGITNLRIENITNSTFQLQWDASEGAYRYTIEVVKGINTLGVPTIVYDSNSPLQATVVYSESSWNSTTDDIFTVVAHKQGCRITSTITALPCFLEGSMVHMADGTTKAIEDVRVHDCVIGAFGEINTVLFLHRPRLGTASMCCINHEHHTTTHHPHVMTNRQFCCHDPETVSTLTYGHTHTVIDEHGHEVDQMLYGLVKERIHTLQEGMALKTIHGSKIVETMDVYSMPEETQLYNLVVSGSHTYHVDGYAVTGWPREDDFNYDTWSRR